MFSEKISHLRCRDFTFEIEDRLNHIPQDRLMIDNSQYYTSVQDIQSPIYNLKSAISNLQCKIVTPSMTRGMISKTLYLNMFLVRPRT